MIEIIYRYDPRNHAAKRLSANLVEAVRRLVEGNARLADLVRENDLDSTEARRAVEFELDLGVPNGGAQVQQPFGVVLGCADARVPVEMIFGQGINELFVVRVAGNVIGSECLGSIDYAVHHFSDSVRVVVVLGHSGCGAVSAAVDAFLSPSSYLDFASSFPLRSIVDRILVAVRTASRKLEEVHGQDVTRKPGYRLALIELSVMINAAFGAYSIREELARSLRGSIRVVYGVYDLATRRVTAGDEGVGLAEPPTGPEEFRDLLQAAAAAVGPMLGVR